MSSAAESSSTTDDEKSQLPFCDTFKRASERRKAMEEVEADGKPAKNKDGKPVEKPKTSTFKAFMTVIFEYLFIFLLGFFAGSGCTLMLAVYMVVAMYGSCEKKHHPNATNGNGMAMANELAEHHKDHETKCMMLFFIFIVSVSAVALLTCLFFGIRSVYKSYDSKKKDEEHSKK